MIVDHRENYLIKELEKIEAKFKVQQLLVGDVIIGDYCFERKEIHDLISSMNHRIWEQMVNMQKNFKNSFVIVEGDFKKYGSNFYKSKVKFFSRAMYYGFVCSALAKYGIPVMTTHNTKDTALFLKMFEEKLAKYSNTELDFTKEIIRVKKAYEDVYLEMLATIPGVGIDKAKNILKEISFKELISSTKEDLMQIKGIGNKIAESVKRWL